MIVLYENGKKDVSGFNDMRNVIEKEADQREILFCDSNGLPRYIFRSPEELISRITTDAVIQSWKSVLYDESYGTVISDGTFNMKVRFGNPVSSIEIKGYINL